MTAHKLLLYPHAPDSTPVDTANLAAALQAIGFIDHAVAVPDGEFYPVGAEFLQLVSFLGCSPAIELAPPRDPSARDAARASGSFCHVYLDSGALLRFRADPRTPPPRCPACRRQDSDWRRQISVWQDNPSQLAWSCRSCDYRGRLTDLQFRKSAGFSRTWVEIRGIYPSEAVPGDALLACLQGLSGGRWQYCYLQE